MNVYEFFFTFSLQYSEDFYYFNFETLLCSNDNHVSVNRKPQYVVTKILPENIGRICDFLPYETNVL